MAASNSIVIPNNSSFDSNLIYEYEFSNRPIAQFAQYVINSGAEWDYTLGVPLAATAEIAPHALPPNASLGVTLGWNYLDGIFAIGLGFLQLTDKENYRQTQNKVKGVLNIISGCQLFLLSYNPPLAAVFGLGATTFAAPAFAIATAIDLINATIDFYNACIELDFEQWLIERAKEMAYHRLRIKKMEIKLSTLDKSHPKYEYLVHKIKSLEYKIAHIEQDIFSRCRVKGIGEETLQAIFQKYDPDAEIPHDLKQISQPATAYEIQRNQQIEENLQENFEQSRFNLALKTASFVGMTMIAVSGFVACPPLLAIGLGIVAVVTLIYIDRNFDKIVTFCENYSKSFSLFPPPLKLCTLEELEKEMALKYGPNH